MRICVRRHRQLVCVLALRAASAFRRARGLNFSGPKALALEAHGLGKLSPMLILQDAKRTQSFPFQVDAAENVAPWIYRRAKVAARR